MSSTGPRMEYSRNRIRDQAHKIIVQPACEGEVAVYFKSARHQPGSAQPRRTSPVALVVGVVGQIKAGNTMTSGLRIP